MAFTRDKNHRSFRKGKYDIALCILGLLLPLVIIESVYLAIVHRNNGGAAQISDIYTYSYHGGRQHMPGRQILELDNDSLALPNCTPRAIHQFPDDFMTSEQRKHGGVTFHIFVSLYLFVAIAIACDDFFVPALEKICQVLNIQPDVAGATFMAAGSSAPEFFAAVIGIFFAKSDIGLSTIVGSAVFNLLLVNAVCGLFAGMVIYLTWWPVVRDCTYYSFSVVVLIIVMNDEVVHWYESLVMVLLYIIYVAMMYYNRRVGDYLMNNVRCCLDNREKQDCSIGSSRPLLADQQNIEKSEHEANLSVGSSKAYGSITTETVKDKTRQSLDGGSETHTFIVSNKSDLSSTEDPFLASVRDQHDYVSPLSRPRGCWRTTLWGIMLPATLLLALTTPDYRRGGCWAPLYTLTFLVSCIWIAILSYLLMWMVTITGDTLGVPDTVMGLTLLAVGTSVPDAIASLIVAKDGYGDMAVSNSVGSNVFDILLCLGLPWLIQTGMIAPGSEIQITSKGLTYSTITLLGTVVFLVIGLLVNQWRLDKRMGVACLAAYLLVVALSCLYELNVFGFMNLPSCPF